MERHGDVMATGVFLILALAAACLVGLDSRRQWKDDAVTAARAGQCASVAGNTNGPVQDAGSGIDDVPLLLELLGSALDAGLAIPWALRLVAGVATAEVRAGLSQVVAGLQMGASWEHSWEGVRSLEHVAGIHAALSFAALTGAPAAPLLYAEAEQRRRQFQRDAEKRAAALGVRLVVPLGLCSLPAFICLGIVPVVVAMIPTF